MTTASQSTPLPAVARVLLVDDDATNLDVLRQTLAGPDYRLFVARTGEDAIKVARKAHPLLVLLDVMMPGIDGYETCRRLKADPETRDAAVIFLSALDEAKDKVRGFEAGAVDFITKPFKGDEVVARVNTHLAIQRVLRRQAEAQIAAAPQAEVDHATGGAAAIGARPRDEAVFQTGDVVSFRFRIVRFLAKGGMGELYEAEDLELRERVALKTIRSAIADDDTSTRMFKQEVHLARQVTHPNVCRIYDVFRHPPASGATAPPGVVFLAMELLHGETLADKLQRERRLAPAEILPIVRQMAGGLSAAHRVGVVHRDFKSQNVMLVPPSPQETEMRVVVTDFGLARRSAVNEATVLSLSLNDVGAVSGTPAYMAPEQVEAGPVTPATDIYALGVVIYEMVTGALPFTGDTPLQTAIKRLQEPPPNPKLLVPDLDPRWELAILRCLARHPADRFASVADVVAALDLETDGPAGNREGSRPALGEFDTLARRLEHGALPLEEVLRHAIDIASALNTAHRQGTVHGHLKPASVLLTTNGVKLLDSVSANDGYMAPEQLRGKEADPRTDIFAFGSLVYQMATGSNPFEAPNQAALITAILEHDPPPLTRKQPLAPPSLDHIVRRCLEKDPDARWQSAHDLMRELQWLAERSDHASQTPGKTSATAARVVIAMVLATGAGAIASYVVTRGESVPPAVARVAIPLRPAESLMLTRTDATGTPVHNSASLPRAPSFAISRDGRRVVYVGYAAGISRLYLRSIDEFEAKALPETEGAEAPFFSPDGASIGFFARNQLRKMALSGGAPVALAPVASHRGGTWGPDNTIVFTAGSQAGLSRIPADGGTPQPLTTVDRTKEQTHRYPEFLPDGKAVLFTVGGLDVATYDDARIDLVSLETRERKTLVSRAAYARAVSTGHVIYARAGALYAVPFDSSKLEVTGQPTMVVDGVTMWPATGHAEFAVSAEGSLIYAPGGAQHRLASLLWVSRDGRTEPISQERRVFSEPRLSPDGQRIAATIDTGLPQVWVLELARGTLSRLPFPGRAFFPVWTLDGTHVAVSTLQAGVQKIDQQAVDGSAPPQSLTGGEYAAAPGSWLNAARVLAFEERGDIWLLSTTGGNTRQRFIESPATETHPAFSPDGRWLAYASDESGRFEVYVKAYPGPGPRYQVSTNGGNDPAWSRKGGELFYREPPKKWMAVDTQTSPAWRAGQPARLFEGPYDDQYDVAADGRFLVVRAEPLPAVPDLYLVQNWFAELRRLTTVAR